MKTFTFGKFLGRSRLLLRPELIPQLCFRARAQSVKCQCLRLLFRSNWYDASQSHILLRLRADGNGGARHDM
jgi:hypothetical protein